jgi:hypothetical protein
MTKKQQQETLLKLYTLWNALIEQATSQGMDETEAARFASREMDEFVKECAAVTSRVVS